MLTAQEIRRRYLAFFERVRHTVVPSGPLVPPNDKSLLFTNAGMVQFKKCFLGEEKRSYTRAASCQKCLRVSGKHNDLENVGRTARHHTFFEMLGNFSFGDYFKREAIAWAWEFVTRELELPADRLWVTIFREDDEAAVIWRETAGIPDARIVRMGEKDNFWTMGDTGPCGPCSEIYIDQGSDMACGPDCGIGRCDCDRFLEIWNLVFTQYDQAADGTRARLAAPNIDTGMGLERIAAVCQNKRSNFDCDLFQDIIQHAAGLARVSYSASAPDTNDVDTALRVIADHSRAAAFLIAEGVLPSNESRGYVLRRLIRRALRFATLLGVHEPFMHLVVRRVARIMGEDYPELAEHADFIARAVFEEERRFSLTLGNGLRLLDEELQRLEAAGQGCISGEFCFRLYDTHGFPLDIVSDVAMKRGFAVDSSGFEERMAEQRERARSRQKKSGLYGQSGAGQEILMKKLAAGGFGSVFVGYDSLVAKAGISALLDGQGNPVDRLGEGERGFAIADRTPFYGESGGQTGDVGLLSTPTGEARVFACLRPNASLVAQAIEVLRGEIYADQDAQLEVDAEHRLACARNHTATHLLHAALRRVLGPHVRQMGSLVDGQRLRFDFSHIAALTQEELTRVEREVNAAILADYPVTTREMPREEAERSGALALFDEKYGDAVRVVSVGDGENPPVSMELCGGTHLRRTGQAGLLLVVGEGSVAGGIRRIEAVTGWNAYETVRARHMETRQLAALLKTSPEQLSGRVEALQAEVKKMRKTAGRGVGVSVSGAELAARAVVVNGVRLLTVQLEDISIKALRGIMDEVRSRLDSGAVACLATVEGGRVALLLYVSRDLHGRFTAPALIGDVAAPIKGSGGGRPDLAQAGGVDPAGLGASFAVLKRLLER